MLAPVPRDTFLTPTTERLLDMLPPFEQGSTDIQAALDALGMELDRLDARLEAVRDLFFPQRGGEYLHIWEMLLGLPIAPEEKTVEQRRDTVLAFVQSWGSSSTGTGWQDSLTKLIGTGWSYREHRDPVLQYTNIITNPKAGVNLTGIGSPSSGIVNTRITTNVPGGFSTGVEHVGTSVASTAPSLAAYGRTSTGVAANAHPVKPSTRYAVRGTYELASVSLGAVTLGYVRVYWYQANGAASVLSSFTTVAQQSNPVLGTDYGLAGFATSPADAAFGVPRWFHTQTNPSSFVARTTGVMMVEVSPDEVVVPDYFDGSTSDRARWKGTVDGSESEFFDFTLSDPAPADGVLEIAVPYTPALPTPTGLAATPGAGGSGSLAAATYRYRVSALNFYGETLATAEVTAVSPASGSVALDWNDVSGATSYNIYRGTVAGQTFLLANSLVSAYTDTGAATPGSAQPPSINTTESFRALEVRELARRITPAHLQLSFVYGDAFIVGISQVGIDNI